MARFMDEASYRVVMSSRYLSTAFTARPAEEVDFLRSANGATGFGLFWIDIVRPLLEEVNARSLLEIGANKGTHTRFLLAYCEENGGNLIVIEPNVTKTLREVIGGSNRVALVAAKSQRALALIEANLEAVLLEGDLNYHTVLSDLRGLADVAKTRRAPFPLVLFANASWPYARRDMYYDPEGLPEAARHPYRQSGVTPWSPWLESGMVNHLFTNAEREGGARNGVLTAAEDFVREMGPPLCLFSLPVNHGLGIIYSAGSRAEEFIQGHLTVSVRMRLFLETLELARLNTIVSELRKRQAKHAGARIRGGIAHLVRLMGRRVVGMLEK